MSTATLDDYKLSCELFGHSADVRAVTGIDDAAGIASGSRDKTVKVWRKAADAKCYSESVTYSDHKNFVACVFYLESEQWICTGSNDATVCIYQASGGYVPILTLKGHESTVCALAAGISTAQSLITGSWDKTARIWTIDQLGGVQSVVLRGHEAAVWAVASWAKEQQYVTGAADKCIYYWNARGEKLRMLKGGHTDCVRGLLTLPGLQLASCANDATIRYWNEDGECVKELSGHTNYIYALASLSGGNDGGMTVVSCGEDSTLRMWDLARGVELGAPIVHPAQSVWSVACLRNGDIVTGSSDGIVRIFTREKTRMADAATQQTFQLAVDARNAQRNEELGGIKKTDLPGPEALLTDGHTEGQTKMVRHADGSIKLYNWTQGVWTLVGDITGAAGGTQATSGKTLYEGKEYDYVFSVDISDTEPPIKLPYNRGEDAWQAAQTFIHRHNLPQAYLDQVANFILKNAKDADATSATGTAVQSAVGGVSGGYQDPFTGAARYVPGGSNSNFTAGGNVDPFTGGSSYSTTPAAVVQPIVDVNFVRHFPVAKYVTFDTCDAQKVLDKLREFNAKLTDDTRKVSDTLLEAVMKLALPTPQVDSVSIEALRHLLRWPSDVLFPVLDITRLAIREEAIFSALQTLNFLDENLLPLLASSAANQLMVMRCLANMMCHRAGRQQVEAHFDALTTQINAIKSGSANLQISIATFYLNATIAQTLGVAKAELCRAITDGIVELLKWSLDLEACYRSMQALGNLTTTPFGRHTATQVIAADYVMDKLRELANTPQAGVLAKLNAVGEKLLAAF